jgi:hypothetical protein
LPGGREKNQGEEKMPTGGAHLAARERETGIPIREKSRWAAGWFLLWANSVPLGLLLFLFSFLFSEIRFVSKSFAKCFNSKQTNS